MQEKALILAFLPIAVVLLFEFTNGFNDCAKLVVTPVVTGPLNPRAALLFIAVLEFLGVWLYGTAVTETEAKGMINPEKAPSLFPQRICGVSSLDFRA
jgi:PiT family inorganic phosphate transporter